MVSQAFSGAPNPWGGTFAATVALTGAVNGSVQLSNGSWLGSLAALGHLSVVNNGSAIGGTGANSGGVCVRLDNGTFVNNGGLSGGHALVAGPGADGSAVRATAIVAVGRRIGQQRAGIRRQQVDSRDDAFGLAHRQRIVGERMQPVDFRRKDVHAS